MKISKNNRGFSLITFLIKKQLLIGLFFIPFLSYGQGNFLSVCDRTPRVRKAIMEKIAEVDPSIKCDDDDLLRPLLSEIRTLYLHYFYSYTRNLYSGPKITSLKADDFSGLASLDHLDLSNNELSSLPEGIFSGLTSLKTLDLSNNKITTLPESHFFDLSLRNINLHDNPLDEQTIRRLRSYFAGKPKEFRPIHIGGI